MKHQVVLSICAAVCLASCNPQETADQLIRETARSVIVPVLAQTMPAPLAEAGADCIIAAATPAELRSIAADIGNSAGTSTVASIANLATRPQALQCLTASAIPNLRL
jgi:hypothetical protein